MRTLWNSEWVRGLICLFLALGACSVLIYGLARPFAWMLLAVALAALVWAVLTRRLVLQYMAMGILSLCVALCVVELYLSSQNISTKAVRLYNGQPRSMMDERDDLLGYRPRQAAVRIRTQKLLGNTIIYDTVHTTDAQGRRSTPLHPHAKTAVLFFGCSFTAGVGVNDAQSYPYRVAELLGPQYQVWNLGVGGWGPHQFLALLESDRLNTLFAAYEKVWVFFLSLDGHEKRASGFVEWDKWGPQYSIINGEAVRQGSFALPWPLLTDAVHAAKKSELFRHALMEKMQWRRAEMLALQEAIFVKAQRVLRQKFHTSLTILLYPDAAAIAPSLTKAGLHVVALGDFLPDWPLDAYTIPLDGHPTPLAYDNMAQGIVRYIEGR